MRDRKHGCTAPGTALVVDDSRATRMLLCRLLRELGWTVREADGGPVALDLLGAPAQVDVALVDWYMPAMSGRELVSSIRTLPDRRTLPILVVTAENDPTLIRRALDAGANELVMKPVDRTSLAQKLTLVHAVAA